MNSIYFIYYRNILRVLVLENNGIPNPKDKHKKNFVSLYVVLLSYYVWCSKI